MIQKLSALVEIHDAGKRQSVLTLIERADAVAKDSRKHGNDSVGKIYGGSSVESLLIDERVFRHILSDICDVNIKLVNTGLLVVDQ